MDRTIALLTDFGTSDAYVGVMKAVMERIAPGVRFIDLTHDILPQNIQQATFTLLTSYRYFAPGTIFLIVVDPGVGSTRKAIAAQAGDYTFVAPDNGLLSYMLAEFEETTVVELSNPTYQLHPVSNTFHGRDIFAPAAAYLAAGVPIGEFGQRVEGITQQLPPPLTIYDSTITGQIISADHFGNLITSIGEFRWTENDSLELKPRFGNPTDTLIQVPAEQAVIHINVQSVKGIRRIYGEANKGDMMALVSSGGYLEIAVNQGNAAEQLNTAPGTLVTLQIG